MSSAKVVEQLVLRKVEELRDWIQSALGRPEVELRAEAASVVEQYRERMGRVESEVGLERERKIYEAISQSKSEMLALAEKMTQEVIEEVKRSVLSDRDLYGKLVRGIMSRAKDVIGGEVIVETGKEHIDLVSSIARELGIEVLRFREADVSGVLVRSHDDSIIIDGTIDTLIENNREEIKRIIYREIGM